MPRPRKAASEKEKYVPSTQEPCDPIMQQRTASVVEGPDADARLKDRLPNSGISKNTLKAPKLRGSVLSQNSEKTNSRGRSKAPIDPTENIISSNFVPSPHFIEHSPLSPSGSTKSRPNLLSSIHRSKTADSNASNYRIPYIVSGLLRPDVFLLTS